jgi:hypothetical protein
MPHWGRPPGGSSGVGRYYEGMEDDVHRFQEVGSAEENNGVLSNQAFQPALNGKNINPDELYFNDMDIRAWEGRASAFDERIYGPEHDYQEEDEEHHAESLAEYQEMLFRRVLDKIRIARAAGNADVQLSPEELDAYQSKMYGTKAFAARPQLQSHSTSASVRNDVASVVSVNASKHGNPSRSKKSQQRTSLFGSKPKKEKEKHSSRKRTDTISSTANPASPPGFVIPAPDGQSMYAPINAYQGNLALDPEQGRPASRSASDSSHYTPPPPRSAPSRDILGAFPSSEYDYRPESSRQGRSISSRQAAYEHDLPPDSRTRSSSIQSAKLIPFPVEPYQYHAFSPASSSSPTSPQPPQYARRVSSGPSEASYASIPRRVPVPAPAPASLQRAVTTAASQNSQSDPAMAAQASTSAISIQPVETTKAIGSGQGGERRRKSGKSRKKG